MAGAHRPKRETPGKAVRHRGPSGTVRSHPGQLVVTTGPRERARIAQESSSAPRTIGPERDSPGRDVETETAAPRRGPECPGTAGRHRMLSDPDPNHPGELGDTLGPRSRPRVARATWWTPRGLGYSPESPGTPGRHRGPSDQGPSHPGQLVDPGGHRAQARVARDSWSTLGPQTLTRVARESWSTPRASGTGPMHLGPLDDPGGPRILARVAWDCLSNPGALGPSARHPGQQFDPTAPRAGSRDARDCWSTLQAVGHGPEAPGIFGRPRWPSDPS